MSHPTILLINARIPGFSGLQQLHFTPDRTLQAICPMTTAALPDVEVQVEVMDMAGDWLSPGGVDLQINGALGLAFPDLDLHHLSTLDQICEFLYQQGIDAFLPTLVTTSVEQIHRALEAIGQREEGRGRREEGGGRREEGVGRGEVGGDRAASAAQNPKSQIQNPKSKILGVHLEGPFLNPAKRGAHPAEHLLPLTLDRVKQVLGDYASLVKVITLAPELDDTGRVIPYLRSLGITVSLGHSQATAQQAAAAFAQGATMVTHACNAMPPLHHRQPGLLGAALVHPQIHCGVIADGVHVCPTMLDVLLRTRRGRLLAESSLASRSGASGFGASASGADPAASVNSSTPPLPGLFLVSDALAPLGLPDGTYPWDTRQIQVANGTARLADGTLSGTTLPLLEGVKNLVAWNLCSVEEAIALATVAPRQALGLPPFPIGEPCHPLRWRSKTGTLSVERVILQS